MIKSIKFKVFPILITLLWVVSMGMLAARHYVPSHTAPGQADHSAGAPPEWLFKKHWMGIYVQGSKIGYLSSVMRPTGDGGYEADERVFMRVGVLGVQKEILTTFRAGLDSAFTLVDFDFVLDADVKISITGRVEGAEVIITSEIAGVSSNHRVPFDETLYAGISYMPDLGELRPGDKLSVPMIDPASMSAGKMEVEVLKSEQITVMGLRREALRLKATYMGADMSIWMSKDGEVLKQEVMNMTFIREEEETAKRLGEASIDLIADMSVPATGKPIKKDSDLMIVRLSGIKLEGLALGGGVQRVIDNDVLKITRAPVPVTDATAPATAGREHLEATPFIQSEAPAIVALSRKIIAAVEDASPVEGASPVGDPEARARLIYDWVYENIEKVPTMTLPSALEVLSTRRGDCNEHTTLYTALARAAGLPTRIAVGLVHKDGYFYYHAWPEVLLGDWFPIDPTLGQYPADATHIRLLTGGLQEQYRLGGIIGKLGIEVLEAK